MAVYETYDETIPTVVKPFGLALVEVARWRPEVVGLTADLAKYTHLDIFAQEFPNRFFQLGEGGNNRRLARLRAKVRAEPFGSSQTRMR